MTTHKSVLLREAVENLNLKDGSIVVDATLGGGGHGREILKQIGDKGLYIGIDLDEDAIKGFAEFPISNFQFPIPLGSDQRSIYKFQNIILVHDNFANLNRILTALEIEKVDAILADLGWSSDQLEGKGMSFMTDEDLDMRLDRSSGLTAQELVNTSSQAELEKIIGSYGEERFARQIAKGIVTARKSKPIQTTVELVEVIRQAIPARYTHTTAAYQKSYSGEIRGKHFATRTFQAIRIAINKELDRLEQFIPQAIESLAPSGRLAIISFHSLEDRIVKHRFRENAGGCICSPDSPQCICGKNPKVSIITKRPITPGAEEIVANQRSRSAKLRVCEKI